MALAKSVFEADGRYGRFLHPLAAGAFAGLGHAPVNWGIPTVLGLMWAYYLVSMSISTKSAFRTGWLIGAGYFAVSLNWIVEPFLVELATTGWMAPFALLMMSGGLALFWAVASWLTARFGRGVWLWACFMTLAELERAYVFTGFPWAMPSYAWVNSIVAQAAAWIGPHGLNFILFLTAASVVSLHKVYGLRISVGALAALTVLSFVPTPRLSMPDHGPVVRLVQPNAPQHEKWARDKIEVFFERQLRFTAEPGNPDFVIWPETAIAVPIPYSDELFQEMAAIAGDAQIITGIQRIDGELSYNSLVALDKTGAVEQVYDKHHLVPFGEFIPLGDQLARFGLRGLAATDGAGYARGPGPQVIALDGIGPVLPLICYEVVFPQDLRTQARPRLLLQITNDAWFGDFSGPYQHLAQARMRAIEYGLPMIRVANTGVSAVIDARGRVVASIPLGQEGYLDTRLPAEMPKTLYAKLGDGPVWGVVLLMTLLVAMFRRRKIIDV
ncbi:MAG: apolipoprotein N-acyltransferase [Paracoccaceae bacterium]|nr:apolipoprotein N-acyltransferase [Paracoccaceae bacterium]MDG2259718.1 apolipoprotein N-acyltransferase [Paracoccaceae bacterium]